MSLTKYPTASAKELWSLAYPLMLQTLSVLSMLFIDRLFLTRYSIDAFNASVIASSTSFAFLIFLMNLGGIAGIFVSQYNGLGQKEKFGEPVWQMIWFGVFSALIFIPIALYLPDVLWAHNRPLEKEYFTWVMLFAPFYAIYAALASFFIGQGHTKFVSYLSVATNIVNIFFDWILIFGIEGLTPSYGVAGAAIATSLSQLFQVAVLAYFFLSKQRRETYGTFDWRLKFEPFKQCLIIGIPGATAVGLEILSWAAYFELATRQGASFITAIGIFNSISLVLIFFQDGLLGAVRVVTGYLIGSKQSHLISKALKSGLCLLVLYALFKYTLYRFIGHQVIDLFLPQNSPLHETLHISLLIIIAYLFIDGIRYLLVGVLTGAGDTFFLMITGVLTSWIFLVGLQFIALNYFDVTILQSVTLTIVCVLVGTLALYIRYKTGHWKKLDLSQESPTPELQLKN